MVLLIDYRILDVVGCSFLSSFGLRGFSSLFFTVLTFPWGLYYALYPTTTGFSLIPTLPPFFIFLFLHFLDNIYSCFLLWHRLFFFTGAAFGFLHTPFKEISDERDAYD